MTPTRRSVATALAGLPLIGASLAGRLGQRPPATMPMGEAVGYAECAQSDVPVAKPLMPHHQAARLAMQNPLMRDLITGQAYRNQRHVSQIDPDIDLHRSWSPMAKVTFQRQRNVERELENYCNEPDHVLLDPLRQYIEKLIWGK